MQKLQRRAYIERYTGRVYDTTNPVLSGWVTKQALWLKDWRHRYFILKGTRLFIAKSEFVAPHDMIEFSNSTKISIFMDDNKNNNKKQGGSKKYMIQIITSTQRKIYFYTDSQIECDEWVTALQRACNTKP